MTQIYEEYTEEDSKVWKLLYDRQMATLSDAASRVFLQGLKRIHLRPCQIPNFRETNVFLQELTGWQIHVVAGLIPDDEFFQLLSHKAFPSSTWLRALSKVDYLEEPDMFHDVFGHVPMLTNKPFVRFLQELSKIALRYLDNAWAIQLISRIYWFTVEFGLIQEEGQLRIYGAGIISSAGETRYCLSDQATRLDYNVDTIMRTPYRKDVFQDRYFVINSMEQLYRSTDQIEAFLKKEASRLPSDPKGRSSAQIPGQEGRDLSGSDSLSIL